MATIIRTIIIEDEDFQKNNLANYLKEFGEKEGVDFQSLLPHWGKIDTLEEAVKQVKRNWNNIDLVFLDSGLPSTEKMAFLKEAGVEILRRLYDYARNENKSIPFRVIVNTGFEYVANDFFHLPPEAREMIEGYTRKNIEGELEKEIKSFVIKFLERGQPSVEAQLSTLQPVTIHARQYENFEELQFVLKPDDIVYVKGDGAYYRCYLSQKRLSQLEDFLIEEAFLEKMREHSQFQTLSNELNKLRKEKKEIEKGNDIQPLQDLDRRISAIMMDISKIKEEYDYNRLSPTKYLRFTGGIGKFKQMIESMNLNQFRGVGSSYFINLKFLSYFSTKDRSKRYYLVDQTSGEHSVDYIIP